MMDETLSPELRYNLKSVVSTYWPTLVPYVVSKPGFVDYIRIPRTLSGQAVIDTFNLLKLSQESQDAHMYLHKPLNDSGVYEVKQFLCASGKSRVWFTDLVKEKGDVYFAVNCSIFNEVAVMRQQFETGAYEYECKLKEDGRELLLIFSKDIHDYIQSNLVVESSGAVCYLHALTAERGITISHLSKKNMMV